MRSKQIRVTKAWQNNTLTCWEKICTFDIHRIRPTPYIKWYIQVALVFCSFLARICRARHILMMVKEWVWSTFKWNSRQHVNQMKERYTKMMSYDFLWSEIVRILCSISVFSCKWIQPPLKCHLLGDIFMANCWSSVVFGFGPILQRR